MGERRLPAPVAVKGFEIALHADGGAELVGGVVVLLGRLRNPELHPAEGGGGGIERRARRDRHRDDPGQELGEALPVRVFGITEQHHIAGVREAQVEAAGEGGGLLLQQQGLELREVIALADPCRVGRGVDAGNQGREARGGGQRAGRDRLAGGVQAWIEQEGSHRARHIGGVDVERVREAPVLLIQRIGLVIGSAQHHIEALAEAVAGGEIGGPLGIAAIGAGIAAPDLQAVIVVLKDEVDHAADGVRSIDRRGAVLQHLHPLDGARGDLVDVHEDLAADPGDGAHRGPTAIDQHQGVQVAQPRLRTAGGVLVGVVGVAVAGVAAPLEGRQGLAQDLQSVGADARLGDLLRAHRAHRHRDSVEGGGQGRARDHDLLDLGRLRGGQGRMGEGEADRRGQQGGLVSDAWLRMHVCLPRALMVLPIGHRGCGAVALPPGHGLSRPQVRARNARDPAAERFNAMSMPAWPKSPPSDRGASGLPSVRLRFHPWPQDSPEAPYR